MKTKNKIEKFLNEVLKNKEIHDNFIKIEEEKKVYCLFFKNCIYSGQIKIFNHYGLNFYVQSYDPKELILIIYK